LHLVQLVYCLGLYLFSVTCFLYFFYFGLRPDYPFYIYIFRTLVLWHFTGVVGSIGIINLCSLRALIEIRRYLYYSFYLNTRHSFYLILLSLVTRLSANGFRTSLFLSA